MLKWNRFSIVAISLIASLNFSGCGSDGGGSDTEDSNTTVNSGTSGNSETSGNSGTSETSVKEVKYLEQPFYRVVTLAGERDIEDIATIIGSYIFDNNEKESLNFPADWKVFGADEQGVTNGAILDRNYTMEDNSTKEIQLIEVYNQAYSNVAKLYQIAVHTDGKNTYVDIFNPIGINEIFKQNQSETTLTAIRNELVEMVENSLDGAGQTFTANNLTFGPQYSEDEVNAVKEEPEQRKEYKKEGEEYNKPFTQDEFEEAVDRVLEKLTDGNPETSNGWVAVRNEKVALDDGTVVIEAYSPKYITNCTHTTQFNYFKGLPTSIYFNLADNNKSIEVSYINPDYIRKLMDSNSTSSASKEINYLIETSFGEVGIKTDETPPNPPENLTKDTNTATPPSPPIPQNENSSK